MNAAKNHEPGGAVSDPFYVARARVAKVEGVHRRATLSDGTDFDMGVHGAVKEHYRIDAKDLPLPVDYIVAATAGWMLGTLNGALEVRGITLAPEEITAEAEGTNRVVDGLPVLTEIEIRYALRIPPGSRETVDRALERHQSKCPTARSLAGTVQVTWSADIEERPA